MLIYAADLILPLKILLVVFVVTIIGATIGLKFVRSENKIVCMWLVPIGCLGGIFALMMFPSITTNDLLLGKRWSEDCRVVEKYERHAFEAPTNRLSCSGVDEHVNSESYAVLTKAYRERGGELISGSHSVEN